MQQRLRKPQQKLAAIIDNTTTSWLKAEFRKLFLIIIHISKSLKNYTRFSFNQHGVTLAIYLWK